MRLLSSILLSFFLLACLTAQQPSTSFCLSRTTAAYHAPECGAIWVVRDPNRLLDLHMDHSPEYHTYSRWKVNGAEYVLAYWDEDNDPNDISVDVYHAYDGKIGKIGTVVIGAPITDVKMVSLAPRWGDQLVFFSHCGQMECVDIVQVTNTTAKELFEYGADKLSIRDGRRPSITAKAKNSKFVEQFTWSDAEQKFVKHVVRRVL